MSDLLEFGSEAWLNQLHVELNSSPAYADAAKNWEGDMYFVIEAKGSKLPGDIHMYLDLWHGECRGVAMAATKDEYSPEFVIQGTVKSFEMVLGGKIDPIKAMLTRKLKLTGNMAKIMKNVKSANELVNCAANISTSFPE